MSELMINVFKFFLHPESELSWIFLSFFMLNLLYGVWKLIDCLNQLSKLKDSAVQDYEALRSKILPECYVKGLKEKLAVHESKMDDIPNTFVSIGILGTFLGLGVAIQGAAALLSNSADVTQLNNVLGIIAFKFQTSVWGTSFSLLFQKIILENYYVYRQKIFSSILEQLIDKETCGRTTLERQLDELKYMREHFNEYVATGVQYVNNTQLFGERVALLKENLTTFHSELMGCLEASKQDLLESQKTVCSNNEATAIAIRQSVDNMQTNITQGQRDISEMQEGMWVKMERSLEVMQKIFVRSENQYVRDTQEAFAKLLRDSLEKIHGEYLREANNLGRVISNFDDVLQGVNKQVDTIHSEFMDEQAKLSKLNNDTFNSVIETMREAMTTEKVHQNNMEEIYAAMTKVFAEIRANNITGLDKLQEQLAEYLQDTNAVALENQVKLHKLLLDMQKHMFEQTDANASAMNDLSEGIDKLAQNNTVAMNAMVEELAKQTKNNQNAMSEVKDEITKLQKENSGVMQAVVEKISQQAKFQGDAMVNVTDKMDQLSQNNINAMQAVVEKVSQQAKLQDDAMTVVTDQIKQISLENSESRSMVLDELEHQALINGDKLQSIVDNVSQLNQANSDNLRRIADNISQISSTSDDKLHLLLEQVKTNSEAIQVILNEIKDAQEGGSKPLFERLQQVLKPKSRG